MPELIIFSVGLFASLTGLNWVRRSTSSLAKRYGLPHFFINTTASAFIYALPILVVASIFGLVRKEPAWSVELLLGSFIMLAGILIGVYFIFSRSHPTIGYFSRVLNISILLMLLLISITSNRPLSGLISLFLILLGILFLFFEFKLSQRHNNIVYKFEEKIEKYISIFSFTKQNVLWVELFGGILLLLLGSFYIADTALALNNLFGFNNSLTAGIILPLLLTAPLSTEIVTLLRRKKELEIDGFIAVLVLFLTLGFGISTILSPLSFVYPTNIFIFGVLILLSIFCLSLVLKRFSLRLVGILLLVLGSFALLTFLFFNFAIA